MKRVQLAYGELYEGTATFLQNNKPPIVLPPSASCLIANTLPKAEKFYCKGNDIQLNIIFTVSQKIESEALKALKSQSF